MEHNVIPAGELHHPFNWIFADAAARAALVGAGVNDIHKLAYQQDDGSVWVLADDSPLAWVLFQALAATGQSGLMSAADKTKLAGIESGAEVNVVDSVAGKTGAVTLDKGDVGLGNVDNTSDASKPVSTAQQTSLDGKQPIDATLTALAGVTVAANKLIYATGADAFATTDLSAYGRTLIDDADAASARTTLAAAADADVVKLTGTQSVAGAKTWSSAARFDAVVSLNGAPLAPANAPGCVTYNAAVLHQVAMRNTGATAGKYFYMGHQSNNNLYLLNQDGTGVYLPDGSSTWTATSDERRKTDLVPIADALEKVCGVRTVTGRYIGVSEVRHAFLMAQDWLQFAPEVVSISDHSAMASGLQDELGLHYSETIPYLVAAIRELREEVQRLRITVLESGRS
jgi:hypothetical protein